MVVWSSFRRIQPFLTNVFRNSTRKATATPSLALVSVRQMSGHNKMEIVPTKYAHVKFLDMVVFYLWVGAIPWITVITLVNIFIGPAQLAPIPEGYRPKEWEYHRHPISRFIARYIIPTKQEEYERQLNEMYEQEEKQQILLLKEKVEELMALKRDYKLFWHRPVTTKYHQYYKEKYQVWEDEYVGENVESFP